MDVIFVSALAHHQCSQSKFVFSLKEIKEEQIFFHKVKKHYNVHNVPIPSDQKDSHQTIENEKEKPWVEFEEKEKRNVRRHVNPFVCHKIFRCMVTVHTGSAVIVHERNQGVRNVQEGQHHRNHQIQGHIFDSAHGKQHKTYHGR
jgi:hypothetical protein